LHAPEVVAVEGRDAKTPTAVAPEAPDRADRRRFLFVAGGVTLLVTAVLFAADLFKNDGHFLYVFDDTAIHLSMVQELLHHGTWGVTSGHYASASSSPGWTLLLAAFTGVLPFAKTALPLALNLVAALWLVWLVARNQDFLLPRTRDWLGIAVVSLTAIVLWFLPGLAFVGMEHTLHALVVVAILIRLQRLEHDPLTLRAAAPYLLLLAFGTLVRYETAFLAVGCAAALLLATTSRFGDHATLEAWSRPKAARLAALSLGVSALPVVVFGLINKAYGEGFLPNSVLAKTALQNKSGLAVLRWPRGVMSVLASDPAVLAFLVVALAYVFWAASGGPRRNVTIAVAFAMTALLHADLANFGWYERYQAYLVIAGSFVALRIAAEVVPRNRRAAALALAVLLIPSFSLFRIHLLERTPLATSNSYRQRYQMALFLHRYYEGRGFLSGELGYTTLLHDGPVVDILGLGTHDVLVERRRHGSILRASFVRDLTQRNKVEVMGFYGAAPGFEIPAGWVHTGEWILEEEGVSIPDHRVEWYAPDERHAVELDRNLRQFNRTIPSRVKTINREQLVIQSFRDLSSFLGNKPAPGAGASNTTTTSFK
jgi:hypothetical protein